MMHPQGAACDLRRRAEDTLMSTIPSGAGSALGVRVRCGVTVETVRVCVLDQATVCQITGVEARLSPI